jgi:predicted tellurium resistance membrane protein TerC
MLLIGIGIASSLPLVVLGSGLLAQLMNRHAWIVWVGGGILGYVAGDMVLGDPIVATRLGAAARSLEYVLPVALAVALTWFGWWSVRRHHRAHRAAADGRPAAHRDTGRAKSHGG